MARSALPARVRWAPGLCAALLLIAAWVRPDVARSLEWTDDDWSGGAYASAVGVNPEVQPGLLVLQDDLSDIRYLASPAAWQGIYCLAVYHDTLFLAASDRPYSYVGAEILTYDYLTNRSACSIPLPEQEGILILKVFGDTLWSPNADPLEPIFDGGPYLYDGHHWAYKPTIHETYHVNDLEIVDGVMYATTGDLDGSGRCFVSHDMGDTWTEAKILRETLDHHWRRMFGAGQHQGRVFIQPDGYQPEGRVIYSSADGVAWDTLAVPAMAIDKQATFVDWGDSLLMAVGDMLHIWDGSVWTSEPLPFTGWRWCRGYHIRAGELYGGGNSCEIYRWLGGADWEHVADMGLDPSSEEIESIVTYYGRLYVSTSRADSSQTARLYAAAVAPAGRLTSRVHDFGWSLEHGWLSWESFEPNAQADVRFQVRSGRTPEQLSNEPFVGPDGSWMSFYTEPGTPLAALHDGDRFFQYAVSLFCPNQMRPPLLYRVTLTGDTLNDPSALAEMPEARVTLRMLTSQPVAGGEAIGFELTRQAPAGAAAMGSGSVRVRIIGPQGRVVRSERIDVGMGAPTLWRWDLCDGAGRRVPSGVYGAVFEGGDLPGARAVRRMVVLR